jgi:serine/threonine-protein kinase
MLLLRPTARFGNYRLERKLGSGGMGELWLARPLPREGQTRVWVVIKRLHAHRAADDRHRALFLDEGRVAELLEHPNIVAVYETRCLPGGAHEDDHGEDQYYIAMEYIDGLDLRNCLAASGGPLAPGLSAAIVAEACRGLAYAHALKGADGASLNLVHRDIAPDNLLVDRKGRVKIVDFGIARATISEATTKIGERQGKLRYMAPEYMSGEDATPRSDVYSMGATLFELCTGQLPFGDAESLAAIGHRLLEKGLPRADAVNPLVPKTLADIVEGGVQRDPADRIASAKELEARLRAFLAENRPAPGELAATIERYMMRLGRIEPRPPKPARSPGRRRDPPPARARSFDDESPTLPGRSGLSPAPSPSGETAVDDDRTTPGAAETITLRDKPRK